MELFGGHRSEMAGKLRRGGRGQSSSPSNLSESWNLLIQDTSEDELRRSEDGSGRKDVDYETAISNAGFGRFHYWLLFVCGWANASDAVEILCISFVLPAATCDFDLTSEDKGWLSAILFIGMLIGGYCWGSVGDTLGRRKTLIIAMVINAIFGIGSSLCQKKSAFFVMRFFSGLGVGGSIPLVWSYFAEFQSKSLRGRMLSALAAFWMIGNISVAALAWIIIPNNFGTDNTSSNGFKFNSWRIFVAVCGIPAVLVTIALVFLPESPKFLLSKGREGDALKIFRKIYLQNTGRNDYPINHIKIENRRPGSHGSLNTGFQSNFNMIISNTVELFKRPLLWINLMMLYISFSIQFGYYGLWLWFPELFNKLDVYYKDNPNATVSVCEVTDYKPANIDNIVDCTVGNEVFLNSFLISIAALPGNVWTMVHMDKLGRKFFVVISMVLSGGCVFFIYLVTSKGANLALSCAFGFVSVMGFNALDCLGIELFPTHVRSTAMAVNLAVARLGAITGNVVFGSLIETSCAVPILMVAALLLSGGLLSIKLPNTSNEALA